MFILLSFLSSEVRANTQIFNKNSLEYSSEYLNELAITDNSLETNASDEQQDISQDRTEEAEEISNQTSSNEPQFIHTALENGLRVSIYSNPNFPIVSTQTWVAVGSAQESSVEKGFAHLFEHLMFGNTTNHKKEEYNQVHIYHGGSENAYTAFDNTVYISEIPPQAHSVVLELEADRLQNLILDEEALNNEKKIVTEELRLRMENNPQSRLMGSALAGFFGEHPYSHSPAGTKEDIQNADLELCKKFYDGYYKPQNLHLIISGPVDPQATLDEVRELYGGIDNGEGVLVPPDVPDFMEWEFPERLVLADDIPPMKIAAKVFILPRATHEDYYALKIMSEMLSGSATDLFREDLVTQRSKALEAFGAYIDDFAGGGMFVFASVNLPFKGKNKLFRQIQGSLDNLDNRSWLTEEGFSAAQKGLLKQEYTESWYAADISDSIGWNYARRNDASLGVRGAADEIANLTIEDIERVWETYIVQNQPIEVLFKKGKPQETQSEIEPSKK